MSRKASPKTTTNYDFQKRAIMAMGTTLADMKAATDEFSVLYEALAKSAGVKIASE